MLRLLILALTLATASAATIPAASTSFADVTAAINAAVTGDTVTIPAGESTWNSGFSVTGKNIWIIGAGTNDTVLRTAWLNMGTTSFRISAIKFVRTPATSSDYIVQTRGAGWRVDNCWLESGNSIKCLGVFPNGGTGTPKPPNGVIDHCTFLQTRVLVEGDISTGFGWNSTQWTDTLPMSNTNLVVIEDCVLQQTAGCCNLVDAEYGASYTVRFTTVIDGQLFTHGDFTTGEIGERGTRWVSAYGNTFVQSVLNMSTTSPFWTRSGTGNFYSNAVTGTWPTYLVQFDNEAGINDITGGNTNQVDGNYGYGTWGTGAHTGGAGSASLQNINANWINNELVTAKLIAPGGGPSFATNLHVHNLTDGSFGRITANSDVSVVATLAGGTLNEWNFGDQYVITGGYPTRDQVGTSADTFQWPGSGLRPPQTLRPFAFWSNTRNGVANTNVSIIGPYFIQNGRDITNAVPADFVQLVYPHPLVTAQGGFTNIVSTNISGTISNRVTLRGGASLHVAP